MVEIAAASRADIDRYEQKHVEFPNGRHFVPLAEAYRAAGELARAERLLRDGLAHHPDYVSAHVVLARTLADRGATAEAAAEFERVLALDAHNLVALRSLAELAAADGRVDEAAGRFRQLLAADPMNEDALAALDAFEQGEPISEEPDELEPADDVELVSETLAELYARQGYTERAANMYQQLIRRRGEEPALLRRLRELERSEQPSVPAADDDGRLLEATVNSTAAVPTIGQFFASLLAWQPAGAGQEEADSPAAAAVPAQGLGGEIEPGEAPGAAPAADQPVRMDPARQASFEDLSIEDEDDDESESFQEWLRSLKR